MFYRLGIIVLQYIEAIVKVVIKSIFIVLKFLIGCFKVKSELSEKHVFNNSEGRRGGG